jgi:hypothetical protein
MILEYHLKKMAQYFDEDAFFRAMIPNVEGFPQIGRSASQLGVRIPEDIEPDENSFVKPGIGGMSVAPKSALNVPNYRRPRGMGMGSTGKKDNRMYALSHADIPADKLSVRLDPQNPEVHAFVEPAILIRLAIYESYLANTQGKWRQVWP